MNHDKKIKSVSYKLARGRQFERCLKAAMSHLDWPMPTASYKHEEPKRSGKSDLLWPWQIAGRLATRVASESC